MKAPSLTVLFVHSSQIEPLNQSKQWTEEVEDETHDGSTRGMATAVSINAENAGKYRKPQNSL